MQIFSKGKKLTSKKTQLQVRLVSIIKWDRYSLNREAKNTVESTQTTISKAKNNIISITPLLRRDCSNLGGFTA